MRRRVQVLSLLLVLILAACGDATGVSKHVEEVSRWLWETSSGELLVFGPDPVTQLIEEKNATCDRISAHVEIVYGFPLQYEVWVCVWWG